MSSADFASKAATSFHVSLDLMRALVVSASFSDNFTDVYSHTLRCSITGNTFAGRGLRKFSNAFFVFTLVIVKSGGSGYDLTFSVFSLTRHEEQHLCPCRLKQQTNYFSPPKCMATR